ncbi:MAG: hypothetical protein Kow0056_06110 [Coriobacteriia bacterium]
MSAIGEVLDRLFETLEERKATLPEGSYTAALLQAPQDKLLSKLAEETGEVIVAARDAETGAGGAEALRYEVADLVYHLLVVLLRAGLTLDDLSEELASRA